MSERVEGCEVVFGSTGHITTIPACMDGTWLVGCPQREECEQLVEEKLEKIKEKTKAQLVLAATGIEPISGTLTQMPKITDIKQQIKRRDRYSIYMNGTYVFSLGESELLNTGLRINQEYTTEELEKLKQTAVIDKAYDRALNLISMRRRSEWEMRDYLKRKDYEPDVIELILNKLSVSGYLNDKVFAEAWVNTRRLLKATSKRRLQQELRQKRVADDIIQEVLEQDETNELDVLRDLVAKKRKQTKYQDNLKLMQYLSRQGYSYGDIKSVLSETD